MSSSRFTGIFPTSNAYTVRKSSEAEPPTVTRLEAVVFDMDGLLLDTEPLYQAAWRWAAGELGYTLNDRLNRLLIGKNESGSLRMLSNEFGDNFPTGRFITLCGEHWETHIAEHGIAIKPGVTSVIGLLEKEAIPFAIATSSHKRNASLSLACAGLSSRFGTVVTGDQISNGKPAPDIYLEAARRLEVDPTCCLAFEDSEPGLMAATRAGMATFLVPDLIPPSEQAIERAHGVLPSLESAYSILCSLIREQNVP